MADLFQNMSMGSLVRDYLDSDFKLRVGDMSRNDSCHGDEHLGKELTATEHLKEIQETRGALELDDDNWELVAEELFQSDDLIHMLKLIKARNFDGAFLMAQQLEVEFTKLAVSAIEERDYLDE